jgi:hypothetical protein
VATCVPIPLNEPARLVEFAKLEGIGLTVVGPDDALRLRGVPIEPRPLVQGAIAVYRAIMRRSALVNAIAEATKDAPLLQRDDGKPYPFKQPRVQFAETGKLL